MVRRGQTYLDDKLEEGESQNEADAVVEEILGRVWKLEELKAKGHAKKDLTLFELAYERYDDQVRDERVEQGWLLSLGEGELHVNRTFRPLAALDKTKEQESYEKPLVLTEAALYPGFVNKRVRWEIAAQKSRNTLATDFDKIHQAALAGVEALVAKYKEQIKNPLAPEEAVFLVRVREVRSAVNGLVLVDDKGAKLVLADSPLARYRSLGNLRMAAGAAIDRMKKEPSSLLVRAYLGLVDESIFAQPLSLVVGTSLTRLGM
jgi:hypothetical protein